MALLLHPLWPLLHLMWDFCSTTVQPKAMLPEHLQVSSKRWHVADTLGEGAIDTIQESGTIHDPNSFWTTQNPRRRLEDSWDDERDERRNEDDEVAKQRMGRLFGGIGSLFLNVLVTILSTCIFASSYKPKVTDRRPPFPDPVPQEMSLSGGRDFKYTTCQCFQEPQACFHACFCPGVSAADRWQTTRVNSFWCVVCLFVSFSVWNAVLATVFDFLKHEIGGGVENLPLEHAPYWVSGALFALYTTSQRQSLRKKLGGDNLNFLHDYVCMWWCMPCSLVQEARQVDDIQGLRVFCCCNVIANAPPIGMMMGQYGQYGGAIVGQPVHMAGQAPVVMGSVVVGTAVPVQATVLQFQGKEGYESNPVIEGNEVNNAVQATVVTVPVRESE